MIDTPTILGRVTTPFDTYSCTIGIDGRAYMVADKMVPWCRGLERDTAIQYRINAGNAVDMIRSSRPPARQASPTPAPAACEPVHVPSREEIRTGGPAPGKVQPGPCQSPPMLLIPQMQPQDLREHRIYWTGLLNTATALVTATLHPDGETQIIFPVATVQEAIEEAAIRYDQFICTRAQAVLQEKEELRKPIQGKPSSPGVMLQ